ncbi:endolytic transglycosylase MltG [Phenylobacterium montanum]|nr:endolytic transglycosylase MltG [Caulobacter sp. S6]
MSGRRPAPKAKRSADLPLLRRLGIAFGSAATTLVVLAVVMLGLGLWLYQGPGPAAAHDGSTTVVLRQGGGISEIAATLRGAGVIRSPAVFIAAAQVSGAAKRLKAGEYEFPTHASLASVIDKIRRGDIVHHMITIPEGLTSEEAVDILMASPVLTGAAPAPAEGTILPETYEVRRGEDRGAVLQRMMDARDTLLRTLWAQRKGNLPVETPEQAVILASIVEKETAVADERPHVAAVFENRLRQHIPLGSDPTVTYGVNPGRPPAREPTKPELDSVTPYNTYHIDGLPPTPICNPGRASLAAVLDPPDSNDLYFVADGTGGHAFASTLEAHNKNVEHWRAIHAQQHAQTKTAGR